MAVASFNIGLKTNLPSTTTDGAIYILSDTGELYIGNGNSGVKISDIVTVPTYASLPVAPLSNKFYYVTEDIALYKYENGDWHALTGGGGGVTINSDPTSTNKNAAASPYLANHLGAELTTLSIAVNNWSSGTTTINGVAYHTYSKSVTKVLIEHPSLYLNVSSLPTEAQSEAFGNLEMVANKTNNTITFYIETVPSIAIPIGLKGVEL